MTTLVCFFHCTRGCGCIGHPAFPTPSLFGADVFGGLGRVRAAGSRTRVWNELENRHCEERSDEAIHSFPLLCGLLRGACHRARIRATRWLAMTARLLRTREHALPLPLRERSDRIDRCDPGEGLRPIDGPQPLTPTLSRKGRGSSPPLPKHRGLLRWIASRSLSSGAHSRDPLARNDGAIGPSAKNARIAPAFAGTTRVFLFDPYSPTRIEA